MPQRTKIKGPRILRLTDFLKGEQDTLIDLEFDACTIMGPAVVGVKGDFGYRGNEVHGTSIPEHLFPSGTDLKKVAVDSMFLKLEQPWISGIVFLINCAFYNCILINIAWAGDESLIATLRPHIAPGFP